MTAVPGSDVLKPSQAARIWKVDQKSVVRWIYTGKLAAFKSPGGHWFLWRSTVRDALIAGGSSEVDADARIAAVLGRQAGGS